MGLDPRVAQQSNRNIQILSQILLQRKRQQDINDAEIRNAKINSATQLMKSKDPGVRSQGVNELLGVFGGDPVTGEQLKKGTQARGLRESMSNIFENVKADPGERAEIGEFLGGRAPEEDVTQELAPESAANVDATTALEIQRETAAAVNRMREKVLQQSLLENKKGNKTKSASNLLALMRLDQKIISDWQDSFAKLGGEEKPEEVEDAESRLKFYTTIGESLIGEQFKKQVDALKKAQQKTQTKKVPGFNIRVPDFSGKSTDQLIKEFSEK